MKLNGHGLIILSLLILPICLANEIPNCDYLDTVDLTDSHKFPNGSYLYKDHILIPPDQVGIYDYEQQLGDKRIPLPAHVRGCACNITKCMQFCCDPITEMLNDKMNECITNSNATKYDPYVSVLFANGTKHMQHVTKDFMVRRAPACKRYISFKYYARNQEFWELYENGTIQVITEQNTTLTLEKNTFCLAPMELNGKFTSFPFMCIEVDADIRLLTPYIAMAVSIPFLIITLLIYILIVDLHNLHGKCFMSYLTSLIMACTTLCALNLLGITFDTYPTKFCSIFGFWGYFCFMCVFFWLNVISFDLWQSFRHSTAPIRSTQNKRFLYYSAYGWGMPLCLTIIVIAIENSNVNDIYKPGMAAGCWIDNDKWSSMGYYFGINLTIVLIDIFFFGTTMYKIVSMKRDIHKMMSRGGSKKNTKQQDDKYSFGLFFRLFLIMGVIWIFDVASYIHHMIYPQAQSDFFLVSDILNALVGPMIFIFFILNRKVLGLIKKRYYRFRGISDKNQTEEETITQLTDERISSSTMKT